MITLLIKSKSDVVVSEWVKLVGEINWFIDHYKCESIFTGGTAYNQCFVFKMSTTDKLIISTLEDEIKNVINKFNYSMIWIEGV